MLARRCRDPRRRLYFFLPPPLSRTGSDYAAKLTSSFYRVQFDENSAYIDEGESIWLMARKSLVWLMKRTRALCESVVRISFYRLMNLSEEDLTAFGILDVWFGWIIDFYMFGTYLNDFSLKCIIMIDGCGMWKRELEIKLCNPMFFFHYYYFI